MLSSSPGEGSTAQPAPRQELWGYARRKGGEGHWGFGTFGREVSCGHD